MQEYLTNFILHANKTPYKECCGIVVENSNNLLEYVECINLSDDPNSFIIDPKDYLKATLLGTIKFICHSHLGESANPTEADKYSCNKGKVPWIIFAIKSSTLLTFNPEDFFVPLIGREYSFGTMDCWSLVSDVYNLELNIPIGRPIVTSEEWFEYNNNLFEEHALENGFIKVGFNDTKKYDVVLFKANNSKVPNHSGVLVEDPYFLHHLKGRLSSKDRFNGYWLKCLHAIYRHKELI